MSAKPRTTPKDLVLSVPLARRPGAKARGLPRTVPAVRIPLCFSAISRTCWRRGWDSNPRYAHAYNGFRDRPVRPLRHPSASRNISALGRIDARVLAYECQGCNPIATRVQVGRRSGCSVDSADVCFKAQSGRVRCWSIMSAILHHSDDSIWVILVVL